MAFKASGESCVFNSFVKLIRICLRLSGVSLHARRIETVSANCKKWPCNFGGIIFGVSMSLCWLLFLGREIANSGAILQPSS